MNEQQITKDIDRLRGVLAGMRSDVEDTLKQSEEIAGSLEAIRTTLHVRCQQPLPPAAESPPPLPLREA